MGGERRSHPVSWRVGQAQDCPFSSVLQQSIFPGGLSERAVGNAEGGPDPAFQLFNGMGANGMDDHPQTVVWKRRSGQSREFNRRFLEWARHDVLTPIARTPPAPHEKGAVERQVRTARPHFFPTASVGPSVLSTCISKPGPSGRPIRKKSPVDSLIDPLLTLTSCPPVVTPPRLICSDPHRYRVDCALSLNGSKSGSTPTGLSCDVREKGRGKHEPDTLRGAS